MKPRIEAESVPSEISMTDINLLVADDDRDMLDLMQMKIKLLGWKGTFVSSASETIDAMNQCTSKGTCFDAIITDVNYFDNQPGPRLTGITAIREIRKVRPDIPVIFVTAFSSSLVREEIRRVSAELMTKPVDLEQLFDRVHELILWHRSGLVKYDGPERRATSVNRTEHCRRAGDVKIAAPSRIVDVITELREIDKEIAEKAKGQEP